MRWIKSPAWDLVWVLNALWLAPLVLLLAWGHDNVRASPVDGLFFALTVPLWFGHRVSSAWLAYATPAYRPLLATQRLRFVVVPLAIAVACFAVLLARMQMVGLRIITCIAQQSSDAGEFRGMIQQRFKILVIRPRASIGIKAQRQMAEAIAKNRELGEGGFLVLLLLALC